MTFRCAPMVVTSVLIIGIFHGVFQAVNTLATERLFDSINEAVKGHVAVKNVIVMAALLGSVIVVTQLLNGVHNYMWGFMSRKTAGHL